MKAVVYENYGQPEVLKLVEIEKPVPKDNELLIRVNATTVNRTDCANLTAKPFIMRFLLGLFKPKKQVMGTEFAGEIVSIGSSVSSFKVGDKVFGFDDGGVGSYAEFMVISEEKAFDVMPENTSFKLAAASLEGSYYGYNFINKVEINEGDKVLVNGASGGIGSATVQLLKYFGAEVTAVCNTKNIELVKSLGAVKVFDYLKEDFTKDNEKYDFVFDSVGKSSFGKCKAIMKPGGIYISSELGTGAQNVFLSLVTSVFGKIPGQSGKKVIFPYPSNIKQTISLIKELIEKDKFRPVIDSSYPLEKIADAFRYVLKGHKTGNVVITI